MRFNTTTNLKLKQIFQNPIVLLQRIGVVLTNNIIKRTEFENVDLDGNPFEKYSPGYAKYKNKRGGSGNIVNLKSVDPVGTQMVISTDIINVNNKSVEIGVTGFNLKKAMWNENMKDRVFLGINKGDEKDMDKIIDKYIDDELNKL